jgi:predicted AlkP superfamily phosphohydrolase/phosphomutase
LNNEIKELSRKIEERIKEKNDVQSEVEQSNEDFSKKNLNLGKIFLAIDNLNYRCNENNYKLKY